MRSGKEADGLEDFHHVMGGTNVILRVEVRRCSYLRHATRECSTHRALEHSQFARHGMVIFRVTSRRRASRDENLPGLLPSKVTRINFCKEARIEAWGEASRSRDPLVEVRVRRIEKLRITHAHSRVSGSIFIPRPMPNNNQFPPPHPVFVNGPRSPSIWFFVSSFHPAPYL